MQQPKAIVVGGLGNLLMSDEGVGIYVVRYVASIQKNLSKADFIELGTSSMNVVHAIAGRQKAVLVDCAWMDEPAGAIRRFTPNEVVSAKEMPYFSLHEGDLLDALKLSQVLGECPREIVIFGIQPENMEFGEGLSPVLHEQMENYLETITRELRAPLLHGN
ncbi:hydrogenase maturation protease [Chloroflexota bacterium]